ncbi:ribosomal RNA processing protein 41B, putative,3' exoribonuclease, putative [Trypanosoma cruzi marinkellei]|uniref:Ribosomal RNA processing protein 41B, putative,3' exoribonuclease, putative n=1 Tax=Trypanosoma cruzi marinkellei TaxID=85056 RepID=K2N2R3_TRYCR|nr:ribosomal RNA processing protein 41B, putative,3' exoribonuclease, putative [Trypanosoma cruzi marinkellei]
MSTASLRRDGRGFREMRGKELRTSELTQFDGSAWYSQGLTTVVAAVNGPVAARQEDYRKCGVQVYVNRAVRIPRAGGTDRICMEEQRVEQHRMDAELEMFLTTSIQAVVRLDQFPRCVLEVHITILAEDGALLSVATNALMCALLDAGVPCRTTVAAVSIVAFAPEDGSLVTAPTTKTKTAAPEASSFSLALLLDPTGVEEVGDGVRTCAIATFVLSNAADGSNNNSSGGVLVSHLQTCPRSSMHGGRISSKDFIGMVSLAERAAVSIFSFFRKCNVPLE